MNEANYQYKDFVATRLYCAKCRASMPVVERLLLVLPDGYLYEYLCQECGEVLGDRKVSLKAGDQQLF
ncbi:MAG: hypothetical protein B1H08_02200 [Candidatus Omnitrophica bacterium 4484_171]|nr:MAG: hypothetical protein B1H08_02200 [Candidatus Omnitrophica bacterium 4484_171]